MQVIADTAARVQTEINQARNGFMPPNNRLQGMRAVHAFADSRLARRRWPDGWTDKPTNGNTVEVMVVYVGAPHP
jgi:hypothetical protein